MKSYYELHAVFSNRNWNKKIQLKPPVDPEVSEDRNSASPKVRSSLGYIQGKKQPRPHLG
jgi:hypothetical protein